MALSTHYFYVLFLKNPHFHIFSFFSAAASGKGHDSSSSLPVLVFIHGESYEWNSGNPYDGSVLAAYANLVVVTLNYRLGVLGKLYGVLSKMSLTYFMEFLKYGYFSKGNFLSQYEREKVQMAKLLNDDV